MGLVSIDELPELEISPGIHLRAVNTPSLTVAHVRLRAGAILPEHSHHNEQVVNVIEGELQLVVDGKTHGLIPGKVMVLPPDTIHSGRAVTECRVIDVFHPAREDFRGSSFGGYPAKQR